MSELQIAPIGGHKRRSLGSLISLYESNFVRLMRLAPELESMRGTSVSQVVGAQDLYLSVLERFRYTTTICLTYRFDDSDDEPPLPGLARSVFEPRARIRVYHDVRAVGVLSHSRRRIARRAMPWRRGHLPELDRRWEMNRFLHKWLAFCLRQGHLFLRSTNLTVSPEAWLHEPPAVHHRRIELAMFEPRGILPINPSDRYP